MLVDGNSIVLKGVAWSPFGVGQSAQQGSPDFTGFVERDAELMAELGINVVRTYSTIRDRFVLDTLWQHGIFVIMTVFYDSGYGHSATSAVENICGIMDHPAILMWAVTNEPNYYYVGGDWIADAREVIAAIKNIDTSRPITLSHGELPSVSLIDQLPQVDVWSANVYRGTSFGSLFTDWGARSSKPFFISEYGVDSYSSTLGREDQETHAMEVQLMASEVAAAATSGANAFILGGIYFEFSDEWWKYAGGSADIHDTASSWTAGGGYADLQMHEEWFGLVDVDRNKKQAFEAFARIF